MENMAIPLFRNTMYRGNVLLCDYNGFLFDYQNNQYEMKLFNVMLNKEDINSICSILSANSVEIEIDLLAATSGIVEVYVFIDDELLQTRLIRDNMARITLRNPEFKYYSEMVNYSETEVNAVEVLTASSRDFDRERANNFLFVNFWIIFLIMLFFEVRKKVKKSIK